MKACRWLARRGGPDPWKMTPNRVFFDMMLEADFLRTQRRLDIIGARMAANAEPEAFTKFIEDLD